MVTLPDSVRPYATAIAKHHFWILTALVPLLLVPLLLVGNAGLRSRIAARRSQIDGKLSQARAVTGVSPHPNAEWSTALGANTAQVRQETLAEWERFWNTQQQLREWPKVLQEDFIAAVTKLPPGGKLARAYLVRYQNDVRKLVLQLPARMGVEEAMRNEDARRAAEANVPVPGRAVPEPILIWNPADQRRLYESFVWEQPPLTTQVLLAQEELWVYGLFCDILRTFTREKATGRHDSPLTVVEELAVGFPAAVRDDRGAQRKRRILMPAVDPAAGEGAPGEDPRMMDVPPGGEGAEVVAPWHPRFSGESGRGGGRGFEGALAGAAGKQPEEQDFLGWVYVDFAGRPLSPAELAAAPEMQLVHLMPFVLRVVVDQRQLDGLLVALASKSIPIDVREVRINADAMPGGDRPGMPTMTPDGSGTDKELRDHDIRVELRGTVGLAARPTDQALGGGAPAAEEGS